jgi:hypothetical protein
MGGRSTGQAEAKLMKARAEQPSRGQAAKQIISEKKQEQAKGREGKQRQARVSDGKQGQTMESEGERGQSKAMASERVCITPMGAKARVQATFIYKNKKGTQVKGATKYMKARHRGSWYAGRSNHTQIKIEKTKHRVSQELTRGFG